MQRPLPALPWRRARAPRDPVDPAPIAAAALGRQRRRERRLASRARIAIDRKADVPVGVQLAWALRAQIRDGRLAARRAAADVARAGRADRPQRQHRARRLPAARAARADRQPARQRHVRRRGAATSDGAQLDRRARRRGSTRAGARSARRRGDAVRRAGAAPTRGEELPSTTGEDSEPARRQTLRRQIAAFERTLADLEAEYPGIAPRTGSQRVADRTGAAHGRRARAGSRRADSPPDGRPGHDRRARRGAPARQRTSHRRAPASADASAPQPAAAAPERRALTRARAEADDATCAGRRLSAS